MATDDSSKQIRLGDIFMYIYLYEKNQHRYLNDHNTLFKDVTRKFNTDQLRCEKDWTFVFLSFGFLCEMISFFYLLGL